MAKMTLKFKVNDLYFQQQPKVSQDACLVQIWWFQLKSLSNWENYNIHNWCKFGDSSSNPLQISQFMGCVLDRVHYSLKVVFCLRHFTASHYHHYASMLTGVEHM